MKQIMMGFTAEASLEPALYSYAGRTSTVSDGAHMVVPRTHKKCGNVGSCWSAAVCSGKMVGYECGQYGGRKLYCRIVPGTECALNTCCCGCRL